MLNRAVSAPAQPLLALHRRHHHGVSVCDVRARDTPREEAGMNWVQREPQGTEASRPRSKGKRLGPQRERGNGGKGKKEKGEAPRQQLS